MSDNLNEILKGKIDYKAIDKIIDSNIDSKTGRTRAENDIRELFGNKKTYRYIVKQARKYERSNYPEDKGVRAIPTLGFLSRMSRIVLFTHLNSLKINLFSGGYRKEELLKQQDNNG